MDIPIAPIVDTDGVIFPGDDPAYFSQAAKERYYNFYFSYGAHFKPKSIYEIGVRAGYTGYFLLLGSGATKFRGIDLETYKLGTTAQAKTLLTKVCPNVQLDIGDSHKLTSLDQPYDLIHIDGDHSYHGKIQDIELALGNLTPRGVIVIDDYNPNAGILVKQATDEMVRKYNLEITVFDTLTGHAILRKN